MLNVPERWVREHTRSGSIPHVRLGRYVRYRLHAVLEWIETLEAPTTRRQPPALRKHRPVVVGHS